MKVEWRNGDLADLAFLRADSIDAAFSAVRGRGGRRRRPRSSARSNACSSPTARSCSRTSTPWPLCVDAERRPVDASRSYFDPGPIDVNATAPIGAPHVRAIGDVFTELGRAGFRVDTLLEPARPPAPGCPACPPTDHLAGPQGRRSSP